MRFINNDLLNRVLDEQFDDEKLWIILLTDLCFVIAHFFWYNDTTAVLNVTK